eukprot:SAG31_NODE_3043_length_4753_cov_3.006016_3_plen_239_part_00
MGPLLKKVRALLGSKAVLYTNECQSSFVNHTGPSLDKLPPELDFISFDAYEGLTIASNASTEVDVVSGFLKAAIFQMMWPHQKALLVPGLFGCTNVMSLNQSQDKAVEKLDAYFSWAKTDPRVAGFAPWHWGDRHTPQYTKGACNMELGAGSMPQVVAKLREMGKWMKANAPGSLKTDDMQLHSPEVTESWVQSSLARMMPNTVPDSTRIDLGGQDIATLHLAGNDDDDDDDGLLLSL